MRQIKTDEEEKEIVLNTYLAEDMDVDGALGWKRFKGYERNALKAGKFASELTKVGDKW